MADSKWVQVEPEEFDRPTPTQTSRGVELTVMVSPYDVPEAVRGRYDTDLDRFVIEFKYIQTEEWERDRQTDSIALRLGKNSGRLLGIEIDVQALRAGHVRLDVIEQEAKRAHANRHRKRVPEDNYRIAMDILDKNEGAVFGDYAPV